MTESNSHDAVVNLKSKTMNIKKLKNCREPSTKFFSLEESCKEMYFLARFLQDVLQKNALSCKTLKENLARSLQGTHFFQPGVLQKCTCWPRELTQKGISFFPLNIQHRARLRGPPFSFFHHCETFFETKNFPKGSPFNFFRFLRQNGC